MGQNTAETEMETLAREVKRLNSQWAWHAQKSVMHLIWYSFLRGMAFGLGSVLGATLVVSVLVYFLSSVDFIPVIGEWAAEVVRIVQGGE